MTIVDLDRSQLGAIQADLQQLVCDTPYRSSALIDLLASRGPLERPTSFPVEVGFRNRESTSAGEELRMAIQAPNGIDLWVDVLVVGSGVVA